MAIRLDDIRKLNRLGLFFATIFVFPSLFSCVDPSNNLKGQTETSKLIASVDCVDSRYAAYCLNLLLNGAKPIEQLGGSHKYYIEVDRVALDIFSDIQFCPGYESTPQIDFEFFKESEPEKSLLSFGVVITNQWKINDEVAIKFSGGGGVLCEMKDWEKLKSLFNLIFDDIESVFY